jgi:hypothetical protein
MKIEYFHKNPSAIKLLVTAIVVLLMVIPLKKTITLAFKYNDLKGSVKTYGANTNNTVSNVANDKLLLEVDHERKVFEEVSKACQENKVIVKQVDLPKIVSESDVMIQTQEILLEGDYVNILKSLDEISIRLEPIKIASIKFEREENNKRIALVSHIVFQSVKLMEENEE